MAFTHDIPYGTRHYGVGYSLYTNTHGSGFDTFSSVESRSATQGAFFPNSSYSYTTQSTKVNSFDASSKEFSSESYSGSQEGASFSQTNTFSGITNFSKSAANGIGGGTTAGSNAGATSAQTTLGSTLYSSTERGLSFSKTGTNASEDYNASNSGSTRYSSKSIRAGSNSYNATNGFTLSAVLGFTRTTSDDEGSGVETGSGKTTDTYSTVFTGTVSPVTNRQATSIGTRLLEFERLIIGTQTTSTSSSYSLLSSNLLSTYSDSYSFRTSTVTQGGVTDLTVEDYIAETITFSNYTDNTYRVATVSGGGFFVTGSDILANRVLVNPSSESIITISRVFNSDFNTYVQSNNAGIVNTLTTTTVGSLVTSTITSSFFTNSTDTKLSHRFTTTNSTLDFGESVETIKSFYTTTYQVGFGSVGSITRRVRSDRTTSSANRSTFIAPNLATVDITITKPFMGDGTFGTFTAVQAVQSFISNATITYALGPSQTYSNYFNQVTYGVLKSSVASSTNTGGASSQNRIRTTIATIDKGLQGGIQNRTSTNISGAIRSSRPITIADELITTATSSSSHITVNSAESQSYTDSAGFPLDLDVSLNRYMSFFPDEQYGSIFTQFESMPYHLSLEGGGSSIIQFTTTGKYSTGDDSSRTTQSYSSGLKGVVKCQLGNDFNNGTRVRILSTDGAGFFSSKVIHGGAKFTDEEGLYIYSGQVPPASIYAFGSNGSSLISQDSTDFDNEYYFGSITLPANSMIFAPNTSVLVADSINSLNVFDHAQN